MTEPCGVAIYRKPQMMQERVGSVMEIRLESLRERPRKLVFDEPLEGFPTLCELAAQGDVAFHGKVSAELVAELVGELVEVEGTLTCSLVVPCGRCLQPVDQQLALPVALTFRRQPAVPVVLQEEQELTEDEVGLIVFDGDAIELRAPIEQELIMALPQHPLCRGNCAGLCPVCGADLNAGRCDCAPPVFHGALAALRDFKVTKE